MSKQPSVTVTTEPSRTVSSEDRRAVAAVDQPSRSTAQASLLRTLQKLLPWGAVFVGGLLVGWLVVGGLLAPLPGIKAEPWHLSSPHKSIYFQLAADSYHATNKAALIEEALAGWDPQDLASALAQAEAAAVDRASRLRVAALRNLLNIPAGPVTLLDFVRQQGPIYITLSLSALVFILAGGVIVVPQIQGAVTIDDEKAVTSQDAGRREEGSDLAALSEGDVSGAAGDGISDLLLTEVFGKLFDVEDIFDPELRAISESVDQVDIASLRRRCDLVNMQLQARYYLPEMEREDVNG
jgi:hypothetical protein